jgi:hypothetical protein
MPLNKRLTALILVAPALPSFAQTTTAPQASAPASSPTQPNPITIPSDPTWLVADVGIALLIGLIVGYALGAWRSAAKHRTSHA